LFGDGPVTSSIRHQSAYQTFFLCQCGLPAAKELRKEKAPDGFIGLFFASCWTIIKEDLRKAIGHFFSMN
jgi:hypothetical protein